MWRTVVSVQSGSRRLFHRELEGLESDVVRLAALATESIAIGTDALLNLDLDAIDELIRRDRAIDELAIEIQERACAVLACQQPMAGDLRTLVAVFRMVHGLERIGDNMINVARAARHLYPQPLTPKLRGLIEMMRHQATLQLRTAVEAFADRDVEQAIAVAEMDHKMSEIQRELFNTILGADSDDPHVRQAVQVALVGRYFERIADQAVSVGQRVDYIVTGELHHAVDPEARAATRTS